MRQKVKLILSICLLLVIINLLSSCTSKKIEIKDLKNDLEICEEIQNCFNSDYIDNSSYHISNCIIIEQNSNKEKNENIIYCNATAENEYFQLFLDVKAVYYREKSNWYLDEISFDLDDVKAICAPNIQPIQDILKQEIHKRGQFSYGVPHRDGTGTRYYYLKSKNNSFRVERISLNANGKSAKIECCYTSDGVKYYGYFILSLGRRGWFATYDSKFIHMHLTEIDFDYSTKAIGTFCASKANGEESTLVIHKITKDKIVYSLDSNDEDFKNLDYKFGKNLEEKFYYEIGEFENFHYEAEIDSWVMGAWTFKRR